MTLFFQANLRDMLRVAVFGRFSSPQYLSGLIIRKQEIHGAETCLAKANATSSNRQVKIMTKLLFGKNKGKRGWYNTPSQSTLNQFSSVKSLSNPMGVQKHTNRRITVLNSLFMKQITDLMATGAMAESITGLGIEVSRVLVAQDFATINVYWLAKGGEDDVAIETLLRKCSGHLRHELSQLRVMGEVPRIIFVKDLEFAKYVEVERILKGADMGQHDNDDEVSEDGHLPESMLEQLPEMRHDVLGLPHNVIFSKIQEKLKVTKVAWDQFKSSPRIPPADVDDKNPSDLDQVWEAKKLQTLEREDRFAEFLKTKRLGKTRNAVNRADRDFLLEEQTRARASNSSTEDYQDQDEERDFFDEEAYLKGPHEK